MARHNVPASSLSDDFDCAVEDAEGSMLARAGSGHSRESVITQRERELIEETRSGAVSLRAYATTQPESYDALHKRRASAERRLQEVRGRGGGESEAATRSRGSAAQRRPSEPAPTRLLSSADRADSDRRSPGERR